MMSRGRVTYPNPDQTFEAEFSELLFILMKVPHNIRYLHSCVTENVFSVSILEDSFFQNFLFKLV
jgi:hypothetical protein